jgi:hypothetical protein
VTEPDPNDAMRRAAREALREMMPELLAATVGETNGSAHGSANGSVHGSANGSPNGHHPAAAAAGEEVVPVVPAPPVAAVMRPSTWSAPAAPGEVIGDAEALPAVAPPPPSGATAHPAAAQASIGDARVEAVTIDSDEELDAFVRALAARLENPRDRLAIKAGRLRFRLRRAAAAEAPAGPPGAARGAVGAGGEALRIEKGAVTERAVQDAASKGARLVLASRAVLTPLARDKARALGVRIEKEGRC